MDTLKKNILLNWIRIRGLEPFIITLIEQLRLGYIKVFWSHKMLGPYVMYIQRKQYWSTKNMKKNFWEFKFSIFSIATYKGIALNLFCFFF